jgi:hypothetical protein
VSFRSISSTEDQSTVLKQIICITEDVLKDSLAFIVNKAKYASIPRKSWLRDITANTWNNKPKYSVTFKTFSLKESS